jgi:hypothetical protein
MNTESTPAEGTTQHAEDSSKKLLLELATNATLQKEHNDKALVRITAASVFVTLIVAGASIWMGFEAHETRVQDERPYVRAEFEKIDIAPCERTTGNAEAKLDDNYEECQAPYIRLRAFGKSPAVNVVVTNQCSSGIGIDSATSFDITTKPSKNPVGTLFPAEVGEEFCDHRLDALNHASENKNQVVTVSTWGIIFYDDVEKHHFQTPYCFVSILSGQRIDTNSCSNSAPIR